ncbi:MAG TPA: ribosome maturation factor RimM [Acidimicrobiia bacterium]
MGDGLSRGEAAAGGSRGVVPPHIVIGRLGRPNGLEGFLGIYVEDEDLVHLQPESVVFIEDEPFTVRAVRRGKKGPQVAFVEVTSRDAAEEIRGSDVFVAERRELAGNQYWPEDLIGLEVRPNGGVVAGVNHGAAQDRLVIERSGETFEVPFVDELVPVVDVSGGYIEIIEIEGLSSP